jgi:phosphoesterase RecJ-like protein
MDTTQLIKIILENRTFLVTSHIMPDGDSIGSVLALTLALKKIGKKAIPVMTDNVPKKYSFLPGCDEIKRDLTDRYDIALCLDCGDEDRLGFDKSIKEYAEIVVNIDHHKSNTHFGDYNFVDSDASSTGEIIYEIIEQLIKIDLEMALCLYTSIITDTGCARYSNTTSVCLRILAEMIEIGVKPEYICRQVYENRSIESINLLWQSLGTLEFFDDGAIAAIFITDKMMKESGAKEEDADGIINYAREIEGVEVAVLFKEKGNSMVKVGFRSNEWADVSRIAEEFNGGGHARASGCCLNTSLDDAKILVIDCIRRYMSRYCK